MRKFFRILMWVIIAILFVGTFVFLYMNSRDKETKYETVRPEIASIERTTVLTGKIEPRDEIQVKPQISGIISEISVKPGDMVKAGDVIATIKVIPEASSLSSAQNRVDQAKISLEDVKMKHERNTVLYDKKIISREEFESSQTSLRQAQRELESAIDSYNIVREGASKYNATESNTMVRATIEGLVLDVPVKVGSSVIQANTFNDGTTVATIADMSNLIFTGKVDETEVGTLEVGMPMDVIIGAIPDAKSTAILEYISPKGNESNGANTFDIKGAIQISDSIQLRAGYSANATIKLSTAKDVLTVPESVVEFSADSTFVYCLVDSVNNTFKRTPITTGMSDGIKIEVKSGLEKDARLRGAEIRD